MALEGLNSAAPRPHEHELASGFRELRVLAEGDPALFEEKVEGQLLALEESLALAGFTLATTKELPTIFYDNALVSRSESFSRTLDSLRSSEDISIDNPTEQANMCSMASGAGFKTAMAEGFSGDDVAHVVKTVITFRPNHIQKQKLPRGHELWELKPKTAEVSYAGAGVVSTEDLVMVSFRLPLRYFPKEKLNDEQKKVLAEGKNDFIVRHYVKNIKKTMH